MFHPPNGLSARTQRASPHRAESREAVVRRRGARTPGPRRARRPRARPAGPAQVSFAVTARIRRARRGGACPVPCALFSLAGRLLSPRAERGGQRAGSPSSAPKGLPGAGPASAAGGPGAGGRERGAGCTGLRAERPVPSEPASAARTPRSPSPFSRGRSFVCSSPRIPGLHLPRAPQGPGLRAGGARTHRPLPASGINNRRHAAKR